MRQGELIGGRFEIERLAGQGGMGMLYRARDLEDGAAVALKVLRSTEPSAEEQQRFLREACLLADLRHPGIVRYIAHGLTAAGEPFLAMEWLEGEDLGAYLARVGRPRVAQTVALGARIAEALGAAHARGVIHRDIKPRNIFITGGDIAHPKLVDFGIARSLAHTRSLTRSDVFVGTPAYAAPEQVRDAKRADAPADLFSLGCVLFECLTGSPAFAGEHALAILAKILFEEPPNASALCVDVPPALGELVARLLAKNPSARPPDVSSLAAELRAMHLEAEALSRQPTPRPPQAALTEKEQRLLSVILITPAGEMSAWDETLSIERLSTPLDGVTALVTTLGGKVESLADGSIIVLVPGKSAASDQSVRAARCALELHASLPGAWMALVTGHGLLHGRMPVGELIDRAVKLVRDHAVNGPAPTTDAGTILLDELSAGLLEPRFIIDGRRGVPRLIAERGVGENVRLLLGKPAPCVGRERELALLMGLWDECLSEPRASAALILGEAGLGKSRLYHEFLRTVRQRADTREAVPTLWAARGDPLRMGSPFGLVGQLIRRAAGVYEGEALQLRQDKLRACVEARLAGDDAARVAGFLGELVGAPFPDEHGLQLRAARGDPVLMGDQIRRAFLEFIAAECRVGPLLLVLDDLHWGDMPSVQLVHEALRQNEERPFFVVSLARPEVYELLPRSLMERHWQELRLGMLSRKACKLFVRQVLGPQISEKQLERVVEQAGGNAFHLEELVRAAAEGSGTLPDTVLAMVQARFSTLEPEARQLLRAASVFGESFWRGGAAAFAFGSRSATADEWLSLLVEREFLLPHPESRFPGEREYVFRHALARDAIYETLTEQDREAGHRFVADWLEKAGEADPLVLARHWERGQERERAAALYLRAAAHAFQGTDPSESIARAQRALELELPRDVELGYRVQLAQWLMWSNDWLRAEADAEELWRRADPGSLPWLIGGVSKALSALYTGRLEEWLPTWPRLIEARPHPEALGHYAFLFCNLALNLEVAGKSSAARGMIEWLDSIVAAMDGKEPYARAWLEAFHSVSFGFIRAMPWEGLRYARAGCATLEEMGHERMARMGRVFVGMNLWLLGRMAEAEEEFRATQGAEEALGFPASFRTFFLTKLLADRGALEEARREALQLAELGRAQRDQHVEGRGHWLLAEVELLRGEYSEAERVVAAALTLLPPVFPFDQVAATVTQAAIHLRQGRAAEALSTVDGALRRCDALGFMAFRPAIAPLVRAEALHALGDGEGASAAIALARDQLLSRAAAIADEDVRKSFLENVPENARTLALARAWLA